MPVEKVDIIISEWMGYFLLFESMLDTVLYARDKYLAPNGLLLPDKVSLTAVGIEDKRSKAKNFGFWKDVYGFNMDSIKSASQNEPLIDPIESKLVITSACKFFEIDLHTVKLEDLEFARKYAVKGTRNDTMDALVCWFDAEFSRLDDPVVLSTSVYNEETHWCQTLFYLNTPIEIKKDETISGMIAVKKAKNNFRNLDIAITYNHEESKYKQLYKLT